MRNRISPAQAEGGRLWASDWAIAERQLQHRRAQHPGGRGQLDPYERDLIAIATSRYRRAGEALGGLKMLAYQVCIEEKPARVFTDARQERHEAAMPLLRVALDTLVRFYQVHDVA